MPDEFVGGGNGGLMTAIYNVKSYGALGDGVTDDTAAIQAAITAAVWSSGSDSGGGIIYFPTGVYMFTTLTGGAHLHFLGAGGRSSKLRQISGTASPMFTATGSGFTNGLVIENLYWRANDNASNTGGLLLTGMLRPKVLGCEINGCSNYGIKQVGGGTQGDAMYALVEGNTFVNMKQGSKVVWFLPATGGGSHPDGPRVLRNLFDCGAQCDVTALYVDQPSGDSAGWLAPDAGVFADNNVIECKTPFDISGKGWTIEANRIERTGSTSPGADVSMNLFVRAGTTNAAVTGTRIINNEFYTHGDSTKFVYTDAALNTVYEDNYDDLNGSTAAMFQRDRRYFPGKATSNSIKAETFSRLFATGGSAWTDGQLLCTLIQIERPTLVTNLITTVIVAGVGITHAQGGIYSLDGQTRYATTGDTAGDRTAFQSTGLKTVALSAPVTLQPGSYLVGFLFTASTTDPTLPMAAASSGIHLGSGGPTPRMTAAGAGGYTAVPATFSPVDTGRAYWFAVS